MCDLIDLNSPDAKGALNPAKLTSPLIPAPKNVECGDGTASQSATENREDGNNNPFDQVLHETAEYVSKKGDLFEVILQRALKSKGWNNTQSVDFTDDFTPRKKKYFKTMNKTLGMLDESSFESRFGLLDGDKKEGKIKTESVGIDARKADLCDGSAADNASVCKQEHKLHAAGFDLHELSILNQSAMNDTLLEVLPNSGENGMASPLLENDKSFEFQFALPSSVKHKPPIQRSLSQGGKSSTELLQQNKRSYSATDDQRKISQSDSSTVSSALDRGFLENRGSEQSVFSSLSSISSLTKLTSGSLSSSILSNDAMNRAFLENRGSEQSVFSSLSSISSLTKLTSGSLSSSILSNDAINRAFLENRGSEQSVFSSLSSISSLTKLASGSLSSSILSNDAMNRALLDDNSLKSQQKKSTTESFTETKQYDLSDLMEKFNKLKCTMSEMTNVLSATEDDSNSKQGDNNKQATNDKLIDVDVFVPEQNQELNRSSSSTCSSDSVFIGTSKVDKSILNEAKVLAKTFEEFAPKTSSGSNDHLFCGCQNNTLWMAELLPAFEDEPVVNDLIDLLVSPEGNSKDKNSDEKQSPASIDSEEENLVKKMESSFGSVPVAKQNITSLLSDLRKLVKTESNSEAKKLFDDLENILDINYKTNTELLTTCFNASNKLQSPQKISLESIERFDKSSIDQNEEENGRVSSQEKLCNNERSLPDVNCKLEDISLEDTVSIEKSSVTSSASKSSSEDHMSISHSSDITEHSKRIKEEDNQVDKKIVVELLVNLQKLLSGQAEADTMQLFKNIGNLALNTALNNDNENEIQANCTGKQTVQQTTPVRNPLESGRNAHSAKVANRQSLESKSKVLRRSVSTIESSPTLSTPIHRRRNISESEHQKRFSSDSFINTLSNKKLAMPEAPNTRKVEAAKPDSKKEKSVAISNVKNKLKKRSDVVNKRGPLKAVHPVDNMQKKRASLGRQIRSSQITPPKPCKTSPSRNKIISSTPNSAENNYYKLKKSMESKLVASSTPNGQNSKKAPLTSDNKKRNLSCNISPVNADINSSDERKDSPKKLSKLPTPKNCTTPTRRQTDGIPRVLTPSRYNSSLNTNPRSPQRLSRSISFQRYSPASEKKVVGKIQSSPLKETNRISARSIKPINLISKIKRHSTGDLTEKENNYT